MTKHTVFQIQIFNIRLIEGDQRRLVTTNVVETVRPKS